MNNRSFRISQRNLSDLWSQDERFDLVAKIVSSYLPRSILPGSDSYESGYDFNAHMRHIETNNLPYPPPHADPVQRRTIKCGLRNKTVVKIPLSEADHVKEKVLIKKFLPKYSLKSSTLEIPCDFICYYSHTDKKIHEWNLGKPFGITVWLLRQKQKMYLVVHKTRWGWLDLGHDEDGTSYVSDVWIYRIPTGPYYDALEKWDGRKLMDINSEVLALGKQSRRVLSFVNNADT